MSLMLGGSKAAAVAEPEQAVMTMVAGLLDPNELAVTHGYLRPGPIGSLIPYLPVKGRNNESISSTLLFLTQRVWTFNLRQDGQGAALIDHWDTISIEGLFDNGVENYVLNAVDADFTPNVSPGPDVIDRWQYTTADPSDVPLLIVGESYIVTYDWTN